MDLYISLWNTFPLLFMYLPFPFHFSSLFPMLFIQVCTEQRSVVCDMTAISQRLRSKLKRDDKTVVEKGDGGSVKGEEGEGGDGELGGDGCGRMRFRAKIKPDESESAEAELRKEIRCVCTCVHVRDVCMCL